MNQYKQLTEEDRIEIYAMKQAGNSQVSIAEHLGCHLRQSCTDTLTQLDFAEQEIDQTVGANT